MMGQTNPGKSISEQLSSVLAQLSTDQIRFVVARQEYATDKEAAEAIGIKPDTVYHWPDVVRQAYRLMAGDGVTTALHVRSSNLAKAMLIKVGGLDSDDERLRQTIATEIIEWELGKATQPNEVELGLHFDMEDWKRQREERRRKLNDVDDNDDDGVAGDVEGPPSDNESRLP